MADFHQFLMIFHGIHYYHHWATVYNRVGGRGMGVGWGGWVGGAKAKTKKKDDTNDRV